MLELEALIGGETTATAIAEFLRLRLATRVYVPTPAAGTNFTTRVPAGVVWELLGVAAKLVTSAVAGNRFGALTLADPQAVELGRYGLPAAQAASLTGLVSWKAGLGYTSQAAQQQVGLPSPPEILWPGDAVASFLGGIDVADQWSNVVVTVREWSLDDIKAQGEWISRRCS